MKPSYKNIGKFKPYHLIFFDGKTPRQFVEEYHSEKEALADVRKLINDGELMLKDDVGKPYKIKPTRFFLTKMISDDYIKNVTPEPEYPPARTVPPVHRAPTQTYNE